MSRIEESIDVDVPVRVAHDQWTQFESLPSFRDGVESVHADRPHAQPLAHHNRRRDTPVRHRGRQAATGTWRKDVSDG